MPTDIHERVEIFSAQTDAAPECKQVSGEFTFDRENGLSFTCHSTEPDFDLTKSALLALQEHIAQQLRDERKCPFYAQRAA